MNAAEIDLAWAAGFVDGEGCIDVTTTPNPDRGRPRLKVANTERQPLEDLQALFGGNLSVHGRGNEKHLPSWCWSVEGSKALDVLRQLRPFLRVKGPPADVLLNAPSAATRSELMEAIREARRPEIEYAPEIDPPQMELANAA